MSVMRVQIQKGFTILSNSVLENPNLSFKAKGLWAYCMSRPDNWQFHVTHLATISKDGIDAIYSAIKELEKVGLVKKTQINENGSFGPVDYIIYPEIQIILPQRDFPQTEDPQTENPALTSTESLPSNEKEVVCKSEPSVDGHTSKILNTIKKKDFNGKETEISLEHIIQQAVLAGETWSLEEIREAWDRFVESNEPIRSSIAWFSGTIKNIKNIKKAKYLQENKKCKNQNNFQKFTGSPNEEENCLDSKLEKPMDPDLWKQRCAEFQLEMKMGRRY